ncbi:MAG TPA: cysteine desulfurase family protein [Patescibacteria group bacterium]|jgi:cysteine desulfurase|nr:cysteine desulfurase family protein [Patescibacteria group bacterium]
MNRIYLDHAATTPVDKRVSKVMRDFELKVFGNPSSVHREGQTARAKIDFARAEVAKFLNCKPQEIIFTSGATEANNHAIKGTVGRAINSWGLKPHVITTKLEHQSVYNVVKDLMERGVVDASFVSPDKNGMIRPENIVKEIRDNTVLVSCIFVSNEIGSILPVREIGKAIADVNTRQNNKIMFHIDAVQAAKFYNCNVDKLNCDLLTLSAHKINGPKGIGCLFIKAGTKIDNLLMGGAQEYDKRPGTQNTAGIIGFATAIKVLGSLDERQDAANKIRSLRNKFYENIKNLLNVELNGPEGESRNPENVSLTVYDVDQDALITALDLSGIAASTGSACVSGSSHPSHVIEALGKITDREAATVRFTLGKSNTDKELAYVSKAFSQILNKLRGVQQKKLKT